VPGGNGGTFDGLSLSMPTVNDLMVAFRGEGGGEEGFFVGDGTSLSPMAVVGDPLSGGGIIDEIFEDFAYNDGVLDIIVLPSNSPRGIYSSSATGFSKTVEFGEPAPGGGDFSTIFFVARQGENLAFQAVFPDQRRGIYLAEAAPRRAEIIGTYNSGIYYRNVTESQWTEMTTSVTDGDIAAGDFTGDGIADVASFWPSGLYYQDGATLDWSKKVGSAPNKATAGDIPGK
jgi:hypothetical protein